MMTGYLRLFMFYLLLLSVVVAATGFPARAQQKPTAEAGVEQPVDVEEYITSEEAVARADERFEEIAGSQGYITRAQLADAMDQIDDADALFELIDEDSDSVISREEWRQWSRQVLVDMAGPEGLPVEQYQSWVRTGLFAGPHGSGGGSDQ